MSLRSFALSALVVLGAAGSSFAQPYSQQGWPYNPPTGGGRSRPVFAPIFTPVVTATPTQMSAIEVRVPTSAKLWFNGTPTTQIGMTRSFVSTPLAAGSRYTYTIHAQWQDGNRIIERQRDVAFQAGEPVRIDFTDTNELVDR
jgi:uncharacterized protein (TIGR03000 family)